MFQYFLAFLLINTYYQSLGVPIQPTPPNHLLSKSLIALAGQCENGFLSSQLKSKIQDCAIFVPPYSKKQFQCLIFYDINMQLCSAVAMNKLSLNGDYLGKINEKQDVNNVCTLAKDWVFTNITEFVNYKDTAEKFFKLSATCGDVCGVEDALSEANYYCKYYMWGIDMLKTQISTMPNNANNNAVAPPVISEPDVIAKVDIPKLTINSNPINTHNINTHKLKGQIQQTEPAVARTTAAKEEAPINVENVKSDAAVPSTPQQTPSVVVAMHDDAIKNEDADVNVERQDDPSIPLPENVIPYDNSNKSTTSTGQKTVVVKDEAVPEAGKDLPLNAEQKEAVLDNPKQKGLGDADDYADSEGNDNVGDDDGEDPGLEIMAEQDANQNGFIKNKLIVPVPEEDAPQKEYFPNTIPDGFSEESDHFFPLFLTSVILMVLLYILYHNKSKFGKVFFGLILEGRQSGRRRNSRGHSYRRLDTLEQAMNTNTAAPPSKIIY